MCFHYWWAGAGGTRQPAIGGMVIGLLLSDGSQSLAATGGPRFSVALAGGMLVSLLGSWGALWIVNRWR